MTVRYLQEGDKPTLQAMAEASGFPYPEFDATEAVLVVVDDNNRPLMAVAAERICQIYLWCGHFERPLAKVHAMRMLHEAMGEVLKQKGYVGADAFLPPSIAKRFSRRLEKSFGWVKNWPSWNRSL